MLRELITINPRSIRANPRKKKRSGKRKHRATLRRNPRMPNLGDITGVALPALVGGAGALGLDIALGNLAFLPEEWKTGNRRTLLRAGLAVAAGYAARTFLPMKFRKFADQATAGALTVTAYDAVKGFVQQQFPELTLGMYDGDLSAYERVNYDALPSISSMRNGVGAYVEAGDGLHGMVPAVR